MIKYFSDQESKRRLAGFNFAQEISKQPLPEHLFHYTTPSGLVGIVSSKTVWMSDTQALNDAKELLCFKENVQLAAHNLGHNNASSALSQDERSFLQALEEYALAVTSGIFVSSFSEHRDQLSQWRAYTDNSVGFNLGFPAKKLQELAQANSFIVAKCVYDYRSTYSAAVELIRYFMEWRKREPEAELDTLRHEFARLTMLAAPLFKHPSFAEEAEWRIIEFTHWQDQRLKFRSTRRAIIPYIELSLDGIVKPGYDNGRENFLLIPGPGQRYNSTGGQGIFWKHFGTSPAIGASEVPYRTD